MVRYVRVLKIEKRSKPARGALLFKIMIDSKDFYSYICRRAITSVKFCTRIPFIDDSKCRDLMLQYAQYARQQAGFKLVDSANK